jgi:2-keto-4-pentenoate hydratase/2-oxohepta-3-ene-1,7-dioic acid hydratase in catechol pathway
VRYGTITIDGQRHAVVAHRERGVAVISRLIAGFDGDLMSFIASGRQQELAAAVSSAPADLFMEEADVRFAAPYLAPPKIWGIGLNYADHASDLSELPPDEPASFIKGSHTIVGPGEPIPLPWQSARTTSEAEIGIVIGRHCRNVEEADAYDFAFGICLVLDQTAEDILLRNPRFLTRSKNFPGFFSFGPHIVSMDEALVDGELSSIEIATVVNGRVHRSSTVSKMIHSPRRLISLHSKMMPLLPGDIISTGTPGAVVISPGDMAECRVPGFASLRNPVVAQITA